MPPSEEIQSLLRSLVGLTVALPWKGYGSAIFLELGRLTTVTFKRFQQEQGEACIEIEWDWRVEDGARVLYGSSNSRPEIASGISSLQGARIQSLDVTGDVPELVIRFSNGHCLRTMAMLTGDPMWSVRPPGGRWIVVQDGAVGFYDDTSDTPEQEEEGEPFARERKVADRWGAPQAEPKPGRCADCAWFVHLDGDGYLLDYGVCLSSASPFDGRAVNIDSGCPAFTAKDET
jgi:hypothetical protein